MNKGMMMKKKQMLFWSKYSGGTNASALRVECALVAFTPKQQKTMLKEQ